MRGTNLIVESNAVNQFTCDFSAYDVVGFHGTSSDASARIETVGFLPDKLFSLHEHESFVSIARQLGLNLNDYLQWMEMRSATFVENSNDAVGHVLKGNCGGQGLNNMVGLLEEIHLHGSDDQKGIARAMMERISFVRNSAAVVYAVDLSGLGPRLVKDKYRPYHHVYWDKNAPLPAVSELGPSRLIARLDVRR